MRVPLFVVLLTLSALWPAPAAAQIDVPTNAAACPVSTGYDASATSIDVATGCGASLPTAATNYAWINTTDFPINGKNASGTPDPNYEIVRCTRSSDTLTCTRAQEGTSASTKNTGGKTYWLFAFTAKTISDINTALGASFVTTATNSILTNEAVLTGTANQINVSGATLSTPQDIGTSSAVRFGTGAFGAALPASSGIGTQLFGVTTGSWSTFNSGRPAMVQFQRDFTEPPDSSPGAVQDVVRVHVSSHQSGTVAQGRSGITSHIEDSASVVNRTITGVANNGSGLVRITATGHGFQTNDRINVYGITGTVSSAAHGVWTVTRIDADNFDLQGSSHSGSYTSGGTATNRGLLYAFKGRVNPTVDRGGLTGSGTNGDDVNAFVADNAGTGKATEAFYVSSNSEWFASFSTSAANDYGLLVTGIMPATSDVNGQSAAAAALLPEYTSNNNTTETYRAAWIKPNLNFGASSANKSANILDVDTFNNGLTGLSAANTNLIKASYGGSQRFALDAAGLLSLTGRASVATGTITSSAPALSTTQTWNSGGTEFIGTLSDITDTASASTSKLLDYRVGGSSRFSLNNQGVVLNIAKDGALAAMNGISHGGGTAGSPALNTTVVNNLGWVSGGTASTPLRTQAGQTVMRVGGSGYTAADDSTTATQVTAHKAAVDFVTGPNDWTTSDNGMFVRVRTTATGGTTTNAKAFISEQGLELSTGNTAPTARAGTNGTNTIRCFNGTPPTSTLTNGGDIYCEGGEVKVMDSGGTATTISPHDDDTGEWIFFSQNTVTGKVVRVDMERMMKRLDALLGGGFVTEFIDPEYHNSTGAAQGRVIFTRLPWVPFVSAVSVH